jgi:hypothetical protein
VVEVLKALFTHRNFKPKNIRAKLILNVINEKRIPYERFQELAALKRRGTGKKYFKVDSYQQMELINKYLRI